MTIVERTTEMSATNATLLNRVYGSGFRRQIGEGNCRIYWVVYSRENLKSHGTQSAY